ncbi:ABC transporter ATPase [Clostridium perfringens]|uniref:ABC transporter ATPase n=1 Tax=Clostridium perfringens TaxID=1502 RepID=UPI0022481E61|nr:ABC transporter ATPase [Clostridium perfringens]MCX0373164.1 ABC transporter ATPase [Clostridium perfringens]
MENLNTIQKREKLNEVVILDEKGPGGANHRYEIVALQPNSKGIVNMCTIQFQKGARKEEESQHGVIDSDLLEIVRHRLQCFQEGLFSSEYNEKALEHIELALMYMNRRVEERIERNVLGKYNK